MSEVKNTYRTLKDKAVGVYKEKGSKFIGIAVPCYTESQAKEFLENWKKEHYQSRHVCYAYRFGLDQKIFRANDDGEPNNSAGAPILGQIQSFDLTNVLIGVVRYFGGTKLGVGGLVTAYKTAAREAIEAGEIVEHEVFEWIQLNFDYNSLPTVMSIVKQFQLDSRDQHFDIDCTMKVLLPLNQSEKYKSEFEKIVNAELHILGVY